MIEIGRALLAMRRGCAELEGVGPRGTDVTWKLATDGDAETASTPKTVCKIRVGASDTDACVPFFVTEEVSMLDVPGDATLELANKIGRAMNGRFYSSDECTIHYLNRVGMTQAAGPGTKQLVTIEWAGKASWMPK